MINFYKTEEKAIKIKLHIPDERTTKDYALNFLHIWNNAREYPNMFYKVYNNRGNDIFVICNPKNKEDVIEYLEYFGEIRSVEEAKLITIKAKLDEFGYETLFESDKETYFKVDID